jgi:hypothetical protein
MEKKGGPNMGKMEIIAEMVKSGYHLMNRTAEEMAEIFTEAELLEMLKAFTEWKRAE